MDFLFAAAAFAVGVLISFLNYLISKKTLASGSANYAAPLRSLLSAAYLIVLFFLGSKTSLPAFPMLIGGALGLTAGLALFTVLLMKKYGGKGRSDK